MDPKWEFNANQFVDFNNLEDQDNSNADEFFDVNMETGERLGKDEPLEAGLTTLNEAKEADGVKTSPAKTATPAVITKPEKKLGTPYIEVTPPTESVELAKEAPRPRRLANLVTSWDPRVAKIKKTVAGQGVSEAAGLTKSSTRLGPKLPPKSENAVRQQQAVTQNERGKVTAPAPRVMTPRRAALKAQVEAAVASVRNSPRLARITPKRLGTNMDVPRLGRSRTSSSKTPELTRYSAKTSAAMAKTPDVMKRYRAKLNQGQKMVNKMMDLGSIRNNLAKKGDPTSSSTATSIFRRQTPGRRSGSAGVQDKPTVTKPVEFNFATSSRLKGNSATKATEAPEFSRMLRSYGKSAESSGPVAVGVTQPIPFNLSSGIRKRRHSADTSSNKFKSAAEMVKNFQKDTPDRFRTKPRARPRSASPGRAQAAKLTLAQTPLLMTRGRSRPTNIPSKEEREEQELAEHKAMMFRAKGVGETVPKFKYGQVERKSCTVPEPFQLHSSTRLGARPEIEEKPRQFSAKPVSRSIVSGSSGVPDKRMLPVVEPQSPAFALKTRMAERKPKAEPEPEPEPVLRSRPAPHRGVPVLLPKASQTTMPEPFSFENRDKAMFEKKEEKIRQKLEEEKKAREFHATPIMKEEVIKVPQVKPQAVTKAEPFKLAIDERCEERLAKWQEGLEKELEEQRKAALFKASEPTVLSKAPFVPRQSEKPLSEVGNFVLNSERRAMERQEFEMKQKQKEAELEGAKRELECRKKREEEEEVARRRREAVHKAQPIRAYKPVEIHRSDKPLTLPSSPNFSTKHKGNSTYNK